MVSLVGRQFDHLLVLCRSPGRGTLQWVCRCSCGGTAIIEDNPLRMGGVTSCGCQNAPAPDYSKAIAAMRSARRKPQLQRTRLIFLHTKERRYDWAEYLR